MGIKTGRFGHFSCSGYPHCKTANQIGGEQKKSDVPLDEKCPQCGNNPVLKHGRFGEFTACSNYPKCKFVKQKTIGVPCPNCTEGAVVERRSKRGETFYGCSRYPDCDFVAWGKPLPEKCPDCGSSYLIEKWLKAGPVAQCPNGECKYKRVLPQVEATRSSREAAVARWTGRFRNRQPARAGSSPIWGGITRHYSESTTEGCSGHSIRSY